jgi:hypothetical protein
MATHFGSRPTTSITFAETWPSPKRHAELRFAVTRFGIDRLLGCCGREHRVAPSPHSGGATLAARSTVLRRCVLVVLLPGCGPDASEECPPEDEVGLAREPAVPVRLVNRSDTVLVVQDHYRSYWPRYFDIEGVAAERPIRGPASTCRGSCAELMVQGFYDCEGIAFSGLPIYLPPGTAYDLSWTVELVAEYELPSECAHDGMATTCDVTVGAMPGDYSVRARSLLPSTCEARAWTCEDGDAAADDACKLHDTFWDPTCDAGPEASARWDGSSEITIVFE